MGFLVVVLALLILNGALDLWIDWLNGRHTSERVPPEFEGWIDAEKYATSRRYQRDNTRFNLVQTLITLPLTIGFIVLGGFGWLDRIARAAGGGMIVTGLLVGGLLMVLGMVTSLPFDVYDTFVLEERYGFNKTTPRTFVLDRVKGLLLTALIGGTAFALVLWFFATLPRMGWVVAWGALAVLQIVLMWLAPVMILPLFNKFTPLQEGELRCGIEAFAQKQGLTLKGIFSIDGSRRSSKANAFFTGFGKSKRIALFDTLIEKHPVNELVGVLAHEVGHDRWKHILKGIVMSLLTSALMLFLLQFFLRAEALYAAFDVSFDSIGAVAPIYAGVVFFGFLYSPVSVLLGIVGNVMSRRWEFEADAFAAKSTGDAAALADALKRMSVDTMSDLTPHPVKVFLEYSHPPVLQRVKALAQGGTKLES